MARVLEIHWSYGREMVPLIGEIRKDQIIFTTERWRTGSGDIDVKYSVKVEDFSRRGKKNVLRLLYERTRQKDRNVRNKKNGVGWGTSVITWEEGASKGRATWEDQDINSALNGTASVTILDDRQKAPPRATSSILVKLRPRQAVLRQALITLGSACDITGDRELSVLEAAHLLPVSKGGREKLGNMILLRADIHLLLDRGLIWFSVSKHNATIKYSSKLSPSYRKLLRDKKLPSQTFDRVKRYLVARSKSPGGKGKL